MCGDIGGALVGSLVQTGMNLFDDSAARARHRQAEAYGRSADEQENRARLIESEGERRLKAQRDEASRTAGRTRSLLAASGVEMASGSSLDVLVDASEQAGAEAAVTEQETRRRAADARYGADMARWRAESLLSPAEDDADRFRRAMRTGLVIGRTAR